MRHGTQVRIANETQNSNFAAGNALENLRAEVVEIEALARAAETAADGLPTPSRVRDLADQSWSRASRPSSLAIRSR